MLRAAGVPGWWVRRLAHTASTSGLASSKDSFSRKPSLVQAPMQAMICLPADARVSGVLKPAFSHAATA